MKIAVTILNSILSQRSTINLQKTFFTQSYSMLLIFASQSLNRFISKKIIIFQRTLNMLDLRWVRLISYPLKPHCQKPKSWITWDKSESFTTYSSKVSSTLQILRRLKLWSDLLSPSTYWLRRGKQEQQLNTTTLAMFLGKGKLMMRVR